MLHDPLSSTEARLELSMAPLEKVNNEKIEFLCHHHEWWNSTKFQWKAVTSCQCHSTHQPRCSSWYRYLQQDDGDLELLCQWHLWAHCKLKRISADSEAAHPDTGISNKAMAILNSFVNNIFEHIWNSNGSVLKQVHPDTSISNKAMAILNSFVNDIFERIATEASSVLFFFSTQWFTNILMIGYILQKIHHLFTGNSDCCSSDPP